MPTKSQWWAQPTLRNPKPSPAVKLRVVGLARWAGAAKGVRLWNWRNRGGAELAADLQAFANEQLLGRIEFGEEVDAAGDLGGKAAAILND